MNERQTEPIVRRHLDAIKPHPLVGETRYWEQAPTDGRIKQPLAKASKSGIGIDRPEFIQKPVDRVERDGRKASQSRLKKQAIRLPTDNHGQPDFALLRQPIETWPLSGAI